MIYTLGKEKPYQAPEDYLQKAVARFIWAQYPKIVWFHVPNGGFRNGKEAQKFKAMGVRAGVSDLIFLEPRMNYHGLIIELKTKKNEITALQEKFLVQMDERGFLCVVCYNFDSVQKTINKYFDGEKRKLFSE
jgi:hypothetical protein